MNCTSALLTARIPEASGKAFLADQLYSYDVEITVDGQTETLQSLGMLDSVTTPDGVAHVPLGFVKDQLPSFAPPPAQLADLRILYGSCRRPNFEGPDAMVWIDDLLADGDLYQQPSHRPHQLFLGGDQIYADDVSMLQMLHTTELGQQLIGTRNGQPMERITLDKFEKRNPAVPTPSQDDPAAAYVDDVPGPDPTLPIDRAHFPEGRRLDLTRNAAQFTSEDGTGHLISFGEFAATYLCAWSNACLGERHPGRDPDAGSRTSAPNVTKQLQWTDDVGPTARITLPPLVFPDRVPGELYTDKYAERMKDLTKKQLAPKRMRVLHKVHREFLKGLPKVRRALANIPTYMILDDHDVTDDYFLSPMWRDRVLGTALGQTILHERDDRLRAVPGLGQRPAALRQRAARRAAAAAPLDLFPADADTGPAKAAFDRLEELFGARHCANPPTPDGQLRLGHAADPVALHRSTGPNHRAIALDNRTRRSYARAGSARPATCRSTAHWPGPDPAKPPLPPGYQVLMVIAPLQVIGPPVLDEIVAPLSYRVFDLVNSLSSELRHRPVEPERAARDGRHQPGRDRGLGLRRGGLREPARAARSRISTSCCSAATCTTRPAR